MWIPFNENRKRKHGNDCTVRAICAVTGLDWLTAYLGICLEGAVKQDMPSTNDIWGSWLEKQGYRCRPIPNFCPDCYTVEDFCRDFPTGRYLVMVPQHVVAVVDGDYMDSWDSGGQTALYYWSKEE